MNAHSLTLCFALLVVAPPAAFAGEKQADPDKKTQEAISRVEEILGMPVDTKDCAGETTFAKILAALEAKSPAAKRFTIRIDKEALGERFPDLANTPLNLPVMKNVRLLTVLRWALRRVGGADEIDYAIRPPGVVITRPRLAAHTMTYDVRDALKQLPFQVPDRPRVMTETSRPPRPTDSPALLLQLVTETVDWRPWETVEVLNGAGLVVHASPARQEEVRDLLEGLRRSADVAVVLNARLYEVDRDFYTKNVAPLFVKDKETKRRPTVVRIGGPLFKKITQQKNVLESEDVKVRPHQAEPFLSRHSVFRYTGSLDEDGAPSSASGVSGFSFEVRPLVSPDRRYLRLEITEKVVQLVRIDKVNVLDPATGKDVEVESPNVRHTAATGTVDIPDAGAILMVSGYRPAGKEHEDKIGLMVARPFIWIAEEVKEIRRTGGDVTPRGVWSSNVPEDEKPKGAPPLPFDDDVNEILQGIIKDVLTNPGLKDTRDFYGTTGDKMFALVDEGKFGWPKEFKPDAPGFKLVVPSRNPFVNGRRVLGIRIDKFDLEAKPKLFDTPVEVCVFNAGGSANGGVIGGCTIYYIPKRVGKRWKVEYSALLDP
jgi:hypothetical protein